MGPQILFRPSSLGELMSGVKKGWSVSESLTCKRKLIRIYREMVFNRYYNFSNKYTEKGLKMEQDAITLCGRNRKIYYRKNTERFENEYFTGEPDIIAPPETIDTKCAWSLDTLPHPLTDPPSDDYVYQGQAYMDLMNCTTHTIAHCLVNAPGNLVMREKEKAWYQLDMPQDDNPDYIAAKQQVERNMIFDMTQFRSDNPGFDIDTKEWIYDIPIADRVVEYTISRNEILLTQIRTRLDECREWMNKNLF